ncbi:MAG: enoyl-CoA hydratase/isomerase family protein [Mycobacteriales bacterium]
MSATRYETAAGVATITLDQPERRNSLGTELLDSLGDHLQQALAADDVRVIVLTNTGPAFCAGADLKRGSGDPTPRYGLVEILETLLDSPKPVVGKVAGDCLGGGVGLAAACDLSIVADTARFGFTEVRLGVAPAIISVVCLPKMRRGDALELFLSGERITAGRAAEVGLVTRAVPAEQLDTAVADVVSKITAGGPRALAACKRLVTEVPHLDRQSGFVMTDSLSRELFASDEAAAGIAAFRNKTAAPWVPARP